MLTAADEGADPEYLFACFPVEQAELRGNWDVLGLQATASYDYVLRDVRVPRARRSTSSRRPCTAAVRRTPSGVLPLTAAGHAGWALGVTRRVLDELAAVAASTTRHGRGVVAGRQRAVPPRVRRARGPLPRRSGVGAADLRRRRGARRHATAPSRRSPPTSSARRAGTSTRAAPTSPARPTCSPAPGRCATGRSSAAFRDLHAGSQHFFASPSAAIDLARSLLAT